MSENGDDQLSSEDRLRRAREKYGAPQGSDDSPPQESTPPDSSDNDGGSVEEPQNEADGQEDRWDRYVDQKRDETPSDPETHTRVPRPPQPSEPAPGSGNLFWKVAGPVAIGIGVFLWNTGVFAPSNSDQALAAVDSVLAEAGVSDSSRDCVADGLGEGGYLEGLEDLSDSELAAIENLTNEDFALAGMPPAFQHLLEGVFFYLSDPSAGCLSPVELEMLGGAADFSDPVSVALTADLVDGCSAGAMGDCDMLWGITEVDSEAEDVAETCGGRNEPLDFNLTSCIIEHNSVAEYDSLANQCTSGFHLACDAWFILTEVGSDDERTAASCGGLREPEYTIPCFLEFGYGAR